MKIINSSVKYFKKNFKSKNPKIGKETNPSRATSWSKIYFRQPKGAQTKKMNLEQSKISIPLIHSIILEILNAL